MAHNSYAPPLGTHTPGRTNTQQQALGRIGLACVLLIGGLIVAVPAYMGTLPPDLRQNLRLGVPVALLLVTVLIYSARRLEPYRQIALALLAVSLGLAAARFVGDVPLTWLGWSVDTPQGATIGKVGESLPIILAILLVTLLGGGSLSSLFLRRGQLGRSLVYGLGIGVLCLIPFVVMGGLTATLARPATTVLAWLPWLIVFSLVNGFTEELWFRGSWMSRFGEVVGPRTALYTTTAIFALSHVIVYWSQPYALAILAVVWVLLGYACGWVTYKTNTLWGAVLGHALADVLFMLGTFAAIA